MTRGTALQASASPTPAPTSAATVSDPARQALDWGLLQAAAQGSPFWRIASVNEAVRTAPARSDDASWQAVESAARKAQALWMFLAQGPAASLGLMEAWRDSIFASADADDGGAGVQPDEPGPPKPGSKELPTPLSDWEAEHGPCPPGEVPVWNEAAEPPRWECSKPTVEGYGWTGTEWAPSFAMSMTALKCCCTAVDIEIGHQLSSELQSGELEYEYEVIPVVKVEYKEDFPEGGKCELTWEEFNTFGQTPASGPTVPPDAWVDLTEHPSFLKMAKDANEDLSDPCAVGQTHPIFDHPLAARGEMQWVRITLKSGCWGPTIVKYISNVFGERQDVKTEDYLLYMLYRYFGTHTTVK